MGRGERGVDMFSWGEMDMGGKGWFGGRCRVSWGLTGWDVGTGRVVYVSKALLVVREREAVQGGCWVLIYSSASQTRPIFFLWGVCFVLFCCEV